jgi:hypothetical protein
LQRNAIWSWHNKPEAIHYKGTHDKTYVTWITDAGAMQIGEYNHVSSTWTVTTVATGFTADDHSNPTITVITNGANTGKLMIFYSDHAGPNAYFRISTNAEDSTAWVHKQL